MVLGLCAGGIGIGACDGGNSQETHIAVANTAIAKAYYNSFFSCDSAVSGGNTLTPGGICSCGDLGLGIGAQCAEYQMREQAYRDRACSMAFELASRLTSSQLSDAAIHDLSANLNCLCKGGTCVINVSQVSELLNSVECNQKSDVDNTNSNNFATDLASQMKSLTEDIGGLLGSSDQNFFGNIANDILSVVDTSMQQRINSVVTAKNTISTGCDGVIMDVTQITKYEGILSVMLENNVIQGARNTLANSVQSKQDAAATGIGSWIDSIADFFSGLGSMIVIVIVVGIIAVMWLFRNPQSVQAALDAQNKVIRAPAAPVYDDQ